MAISMASPIQVLVDSSEDLQKIGAKIQHETIQKISESDYLTFKVSWTPTFAIPEHGGYRMDLIIGDIGGVGPTDDQKVQVRWKTDAKGVCEADFSLVRSEVAKASIAFWGSDDYAYFMSIKDFINGFPEPRDTVFFLEPRKHKNR